TLNFQLFKLTFIVFTILASKRITSLQSLYMELNSVSCKNWLSFKSINQYSVSFASLRAMFILFKKSALDWACSASFIKAPMEVPLLNTCLDKTNSFFSEISHLYSWIILKAKEYDFGATILLFMLNQLKVQTYGLFSEPFPLSTFNFHFSTKQLC
ncbi:hypothetical protein EZS27_014063, partial [termite gut metagenome]